MAARLELWNGQTMPLLGIGTFSGFDICEKTDNVLCGAVKTALTKGYRHIDCAYAYNNEKVVGEAIHYGLNQLGIKRQDLFVVSKLWNEYHKPQDVEPALRQTLANLGLQQLDLFLMHWPFAFKRQYSHGMYPVDFTCKFEYDVETHPTNTWLAMEKLVTKGLVKSIGVSNFNSRQLQDILSRGQLKPSVNQVECHPYLNQEKLVSFCHANGIRVTAYSPLGCRDRLWAVPGQTEILQDPSLVEMSKKYHKSVAQIVLKWQMSRGIAVIPRMKCRAHIEDNLEAASYEWGLSEEDVFCINSLNKDERLYLPIVEDGLPWCSDHPHYPFHSLV